jgi:small subunit ribosomal protein S6
MNKYEAMFIVKPDLSEEDKKTLLNQISDVVVKHNGNALSLNVWADKRKLYFPIRKYREGTYYLLNFTIAPLSVREISHAYRLNENILRFVISRL